MTKKFIKLGVRIFVSILGLYFLYTSDYVFASSDDQRTEIIYQYLDHKYSKFDISQQIKEREKMKNIFNLIKSKTDNLELRTLVDDLSFKAEWKINALIQYEKQEENTIVLSDLDQLRVEILELVNLERQKIGLTRLTMNPKLNLSAQGHAEYMAKTNDFAHTTKDGLEFYTRIQNAGYQGHSMGENIAWNQRTAKQVVEAWMDSPGHKANILNPKFSELGVGFKDYYWVQNFGG